MNYAYNQDYFILIICTLSHLYKNQSKKPKIDKGIPSIVEKILKKSTLL